MFEFKEIYRAYLKCRKLKRNTINALTFEQNLLENLCNLETSLNNSSYLPKRLVCFLTSSPKLREVFASDFSDRVVHHIVVPLLEQLYEPKFIYDSYSNRKNRGIHSATKRARHFMRGSKYYLQLDIKSFFYSIDKNILFLKLKKEIIKNYNKKVTSTQIQMHEILNLVYIIIFQDVTKNVIIKANPQMFKNLPPHKTLFKISKDKGLPIGNLTSQFFANVYMNDFDNFIKRKLKSKRYLRYVDDFVLFADSKEELLYFYQEITKYLSKELKLQLREKIYRNPKLVSGFLGHKLLRTPNFFKTFLAETSFSFQFKAQNLFWALNQPRTSSSFQSKITKNLILKNNNDGLDFLGYIIRPNYILARKRVVNNYKYKKAKYLQDYERQEGKMSLEEIKKFLSVQASFVGHIKHANSFNLLHKVGKIDEKGNPFDYDRS